jgi:Fe-S-cluster containining protein
MFKCKEGCKAECCGMIPIPKKTYKKHKKKIPVKNVIRIEKYNENILIYTNNALCIFLLNNRCSIYSDRPTVCKVYGIEPRLPCPYVKSDGTERSISEINKIKDEIVAMTTMYLHLFNGIQ